jgi:predicted RNA-binding Zn ribbon-like protein
MPERFPPTDVSDLRLLAGDLALDFANTLDPRAGPNPVDLVVTVDDLTRWGQLAGLLDEREARAIGASARSDSGRAERLLREARAARELIHRTFAALARSAEPGAADLRELSRRYQKALASFELHADRQELAWISRPETDGLERVVAAVVRSAVELLTSPRVARVKECAARAECGWLFLDTTRSGTRRWCRMSGCGSRAKARRHYARQAGHVTPLPNARTARG